MLRCCQAIPLTTTLITPSHNETTGGKMVRHNNVIPNQHFHKDWQNRVKTWFDQVRSRASVH